MSEANISAWATWREIRAQPNIWRQWSTVCDFASHQSWINKQSFDEVWFCGAGTSQFIGDIIAAGLEGQRGGYRFRSVATTDLVTRPQAFLRDRKPLVVSFGRSGNSSESLGTLDVLDVLVPMAPRLNITCNADSALSTRQSAFSRAIILPPETHDSGFAMTSSFSTMLLTALMLFSTDAMTPERLVRAADNFDLVQPRMLSEISNAPDRAVFLGTGAMAYAAREASLKVMELSAGKIPCLWDSVLGFRHGPKSFVTDATEIVVFTTLHDPAAQYEADLIAELCQQFPEAKVTSIGPDADINLAHPDGAVWAAPNAILYAQLAGATWSHAGGLNVDNPFEGQGTLSRVVSGVRLYGVAT